MTPLIPAGDLLVPRVPVLNSADRGHSAVPQAHNRADDNKSHEAHCGYRLVPEQLCLAKMHRLEVVQHLEQLEADDALRRFGGVLRWLVPLDVLAEGEAHDLQSRDYE